MLRVNVNTTAECFLTDCNILGDNKNYLLRELIAIAKTKYPELENSCKPNSCKNFVKIKENNARKKSLFC